MRRWWLNTKLDRLTALGEKSRDAAVAAKKEPDTATMFWPERRRIIRQLQQLETARLFREARWLSVPLPDENDESMWEDDRHAQRFYLSEKGQFTLRSALRSERKDRQETWRLWLPAIAAGLSAVAAWVAAFRR